MNNMILDLIQKPNDIKKVNKEDYNELADEIREYQRRTSFIKSRRCGTYYGTASYHEPAKGQNIMGCRSSGVCP